MENTVKITFTKTHFLGLKHKVRIITLSDLHFSKKMKMERIMAILDLASSLKPNYLFWLGDNLDDTNVLEVERKRQEFLDICEKSGNIATTAISLADHDMRYYTENGIVEDRQDSFWREVSQLNNVHVLDNSIYEDDIIRIAGYTMPTYYYHGAYPLPEDSVASINRKDEDVWVLIEDMRRNSFLFNTHKEKINELLFHSPINLRNGIIKSRLSGFQHIHSGHMHEGLTPPLFDEIVPKTLGMISPQRTFFPVQARNIYQMECGTLCLINGGITKISESQKAVLQHLNHVFPIHMDVLDISDGKAKTYKREYSYKVLDY